MSVHEIHLCQPDGRKSCAACCGLYNYVDNTRDSLVKRLENRTRLFAGVRSGERTIDEYRDIVRHREDNRRIYKTIYTCEFVGFLDPEHQTVGCMLHPYHNDGKDLRDISFYGQEICDGHFCPSYQKLDPNEVRIILDVVDDWYVYGSVITDIDFVKTFLGIIRDRLCEELVPAKVVANPALVSILKQYFNFKVYWPFRDNTRPRFGKYYFVGEEYDIDKIDYESLGCEVSPFDAIFLSLASRFTKAAEVKNANEMINTMVDGFVDEYRKAD